MCDPDFIAPVDLAGHREAALTMLVFGYAYLAAVLRGLTMYQRQHYSELNLASSVWLCVLMYVCIQANIVNPLQAASTDS